MACKYKVLYNLVQRVSSNVLEKTTRHRGDDSLDKVLAMEGQGPELDPSTHESWA